MKLIFEDHAGAIRYDLEGGVERRTADLLGW